MQFTRLWPLAFGILVPVLILLYMLKKQNAPKTVSSIFLWQEIYETTYANKPWQKLRNHILLFLQIMAIILFILSLMGPKLPWGMGYYKNVIFVVDDSASMNAVYEKRSRLDDAKAWMKAYIERANGETKGYIITTSDTATLTLAGSKDEQRLFRGIEAIEPTYGGANLEVALQMAQTLGESLNEAYEIVVLTDQKVQGTMKSGRYIYFGKSGLNGAITLMSHQITKEGIVILIQVSNKGSEPYIGDVSLYGEDTLLDVQEVKLGVGESATLHITVNQDTSSLNQYGFFKGELSTRDALEEDNIYYYVQHEVQRRKVLLVTTGNIFLEKALMTLEDCEIYKTSDLSLLNSEEQYDLYVLDRQDISSLPKNGNVLMIDCQIDTLLEETPLMNTQKLEVNKENVPDYLKNVSFMVNECNTYKVPYWAKSILSAGNQSVAMIGEKDGQKISILGFDLWNSDFVLKTEFPLLIYYLGEQLLDTARINQSNFISDETITFRQRDINEVLRVKSPTNELINLEHNSFRPLEQLGIYQLEIENQKGTQESLMLAVNYPTRTESDLSQQIIGEETTTEQAGSIKAHKDITPYIIIILLGVILAEWYFYRKGY